MADFVTMYLATLQTLQIVLLALIGRKVLRSSVKAELEDDKK